jgi:hypothetical protein
MTAPAPIAVRWDGDAFVPISQRFARQADKDFVCGEVYHMVVEEPRSAKSHRHEFAWLREAWRSLPEDLAPLYPSEEHLRKRALIEAGFYTEQAIDAGSRAAALRVAAAIPALDEFAFVKIEGATVLVRRARSQSLRAMGAKDFAQSKAAILGIIADMLSVPADVLRRQGEAA